MKYILMIILAGILALFSSTMTALGMANLFAASGLFILILFIVIDLGRFILFNFVVDEWKNLRKIKYIIVFILTLLFIYSGVGIYAKLDTLVAPLTKQAMMEAAYYNKSNQNASITEGLAEDSLKVAKDEYAEAIAWNKKDHENCLLRAQSAEDVAAAENKCNNTKRRLDQKASTALKAARSESKQALIDTEQTIQQKSKNQTEIAAILTTVCKLTGKECTSYDDLQLALSIIIGLVIIGTDYLQLAIVLAVNTRKNKRNIVETPQTKVITPVITPKQSVIKKEITAEQTGTLVLTAIPPHAHTITASVKQEKRKKLPYHRFIFGGARPTDTRK